MGKQTVVTYGNLSIQMVYKFCTQIISRSGVKWAMRSYPEIFGKDESGEKYDGFLDNIFSGRTSLTLLKLEDDNGLMEVYRRFFKKIDKEFKFPEWTRGVLILIFFANFRDMLRSVCPYELPKNTTVKYIYAFSVFCMIWYTTFRWKDDGFPLFSLLEIKKRVKQLLDDSFDVVFSEIYARYGEFEFLRKLETEFAADKIPDAMGMIKRVCKKKCDMQWDNLEHILQVLKKEEAGKLFSDRLIVLFLLQNMYKATEKVLNISIKELRRIDHIVLEWTELPERDTHNLLDELLGGSFSANIGEKYKIKPIVALFIQKYGYVVYEEQLVYEAAYYLFMLDIEEIPREFALKPPVRFERDRVESFISRIKQELPHSSVFFENWIQAHYSLFFCVDVQSTDTMVEKALWYFKQAFDRGKEYMGKFQVSFTRNYLALALYFNPKSQIPGDLNQTPIPVQVKPVYEYQYIFDSGMLESCELVFLHLDRKENFWMRFPVELFHNPNSAWQRFNEDFTVTDTILHSPCSTLSALAHLAHEYCCLRLHVSISIPDSKLEEKLSKKFLDAIDCIDLFSHKNRPRLLEYVIEKILTAFDFELFKKICDKIAADAKKNGIRLDFTELKISAQQLSLLEFVEDQQKDILQTRDAPNDPACLYPSFSFLSLGRPVVFPQALENFDHLQKYLVVDIFSRT